MHVIVAKFIIIINKIISKKLVKRIATNRLIGYNYVTARTAQTVVKIFHTTKVYDFDRKKLEKNTFSFFAYLRRLAIWLKFRGLQFCTQSQRHHRASGL